MWWIGEPSQCHIGACSKYFFSSSRFQGSSHGSWQTNVQTALPEGGAYSLTAVNRCATAGHYKVREHTVRGTRGLSRGLVSSVFKVLHPVLQLCSTGAHEHLGVHHWTWVEERHDTSLTQSEGFILTERRNFHRLTANLEHVPRIGRVGIPRRDSERKSRNGKKALQDTRRQEHELMFMVCWLIFQGQFSVKRLREYISEWVWNIQMWKTLYVWQVSVISLFEVFATYF